MAVSCQTAPLVPLRRPTKKQSMPTSSPGRSGVDVALWLGPSGWSIDGAVAGDEGVALVAGREPGHRRSARPAVAEARAP